MLNVFTLANGRLFQEEIDASEALAHVTPVWVDLEAPTAQEKRWIQDRFGLTIPENIGYPYTRELLANIRRE